ncbi:PXA domain-containing protein [Aspergillus avenaceus]|uniref:PXA domain-containing protein n=1 Tax=Aspergillus avenaceus TaxID=36643 RepID=A0A5N6TLM7_ASPAV|nr:PXA domain-containing protein [Aspergillus avenaceus]
MALKCRDIVLLGIGAFIAWGFAVRWLPTLRYLGYAAILGALSSSVALFGLVLFTIRNQDDTIVPRSQSVPVSFLIPQHWQQELHGLQKRSTYQHVSLYPQSFIVSGGIDELLALITRDFITSWYKNINPSPIFVNEVDRIIRVAIGNLHDKLSTVDLTSLIVARIFPILTTHLKEFDVAERSVRGRNLTRNVTESEELSIAIASKYCDGHLHPAAALSLSDQKLVEQEYLRKIIVGLLPQLLPERLLSSRIVSILIRELLACAVLLPIVSSLSDPDTWNQLVEAYGQTALQDRKTVRKLRAALDEHASPVPKSKHGNQIPRLSPHDSERAFERFVRAIRRCNNLSDARRFRALVASQLKREAMVEGQDPVYLRRLETGKRVLDQKVAKLSTPASGYTSHASAAATHFRRQNTLHSREASLVDVMHDAPGLSYFMEFMDRQQLMFLVQFWIVVDGFRNPLEDDFGDETSPSSTTWTETDRNDMALISETYLTKPELRVTSESRRAVKAFLSAGRRASQDQYRKARTVILTTQSAVLEELEHIHYPKFKQSDLFYKYLTTDEASYTEINMEPGEHESLSPTPKVSERRPLPPLMGRTASHPGPRSQSLRRAAVSSTDVRSMGKLFDDDDSSKHSLDSERSVPLFDDDCDTDPLAMSTHSLGQDSQNGDNEANHSQLLKTMEAALNDIITNEPKNTRLEDTKSSDASSPRRLSNDQAPKSPRSSIELIRAEDKTKPNIASLGLIDQSPRLGVFADDLFPDPHKFIEDEYEEPMEMDHKDPADEVHEAAPGDLGLTEAIEALTVDIERLGSQESVVDALTRKAELTNNTAELRILRKSKASIQRESRRKEMQRQQYILQESDNSLYGRSTVQIQSIVVGKEQDGREYAMYVVEVQRNAGEQMPAASWVVARRYSEFHDLHYKLRMRYPSVRHLEFPRRRMVMKLQKEFLQKRRLALEAYLRKLLLLPEVCRSRDLRSFLSQRAIIPRDEAPRDGESKDLVTRIYNSVADGMDDFLGNFGVLDQLSTAGQNLMSAATNQQASTASDSGLATEDAVTAAEAEAELNAYEDRELEPFIKPICDLFLEAFELNKGNNWLRGRAVVVVLHQLLGGTIERKVREGARSLAQDESLLRYLGLAKETLWPGGSLRQSKIRTVSERLKSRTEASLVLATLVPDLAGNVVGRANAQGAARRIFATMNNQRLNTHLVFTILDEIVVVLFGGETARIRYGVV